MCHLKKKEDQASKMLWNFLASDDGQCPKSQSRLYRMTFLTVMECKSCVQQEEDSFQTGLEFKEETSDMLLLSIDL
jgi:hypothetical protein